MLAQYEIQMIMEWAVKDAVLWREKNGTKKATERDALGGWDSVCPAGYWGSPEAHQAAARFYVDTWSLISRYLEAADGVDSGECRECGDETGHPAVLLCHAHERAQERPTWRANEQKSAEIARLSEALEESMND